MFGYLDFLFLSYAGRIGRTSYWLSFLVLGIVEVGAVLLLLKLAGGNLAQLRADPDTVTQDVLMHVLLPVSIVSLLFLYPAYALSTKRWHDRGKSGWWNFIVLVPVIGGLWALIELGFLGGDDGANDYGVR